MLYKDNDAFTPCTTYSPPRFDVRPSLCRCPAWCYAADHVPPWRVYRGQSVWQVSSAAQWDWIRCAPASKHSVKSSLQRTTLNLPQTHWSGWAAWQICHPRRWHSNPPACRASPDHVWCAADLKHIINYIIHLFTLSEMSTHRRWSPADLSHCDSPAHAATRPRHRQSFHYPMTFDLFSALGLRLLCCRCCCLPQLLRCSPIRRVCAWCKTTYLAYLCPLL